MRDNESGGGPLDRALRLFTDVRSGEGFTVLLLALNVFLLLTAYYFIKPLREALITEDSRVVYAVVDGIPILLENRGIGTTQLQDF